MAVKLVGTENADGAPKAASLAELVFSPRSIVAAVAFSVLVFGIALCIPLVPGIQVEYFLRESSCALRSNGLCSGEASAFNGVANSIMALGIFLMSPMYGEASDRRGRKALLLAGLTAKLLPFMLLCMAPDNIWPFYAATAISGLAPAPEALIYAMIADVAPGSCRMQIFGWCAAFFLCAFSAGAGFSTILQRGHTAIEILGLGVCCGALSLMVLALCLPETRPVCAEDGEGEAETGKIVRSRSLAQVLAGTSQEEHLLRCAAWIGLISYLPQEGVASISFFYVKSKLGISSQELSYVGGEMVCILGVGGMLWQTVGFMLLKRLFSNGARMYQALLCVNLLHVLVYIVVWAPWVFVANGLLAGGPMAQPTILRALVSKALPADRQGRASGVLTSVAGACSALAPVLFSSLLFLGGRIGIPEAPYASGVVLILASFWLTSRWLSDAESRSCEEDSESKRTPLLGA